MNNALYATLANAKCGHILAPAGCGKTEAIIQTVKSFCTGKQLILTHTNAGVSALKKRFKENAVPSSSFHVDTISGWALGWVQKYKELSGYSGSLPIPDNNEWSSLYIAARQLLDQSFVQWVISCSYSGALIDEYQDCTVAMHELIIDLKKIIPCRVLGDPLQGIFGFNEPLIEWSEVEVQFSPKLGELNTPHRWIKVQNQPLGDWLIKSRTEFEAGNIPDLRASPVIVETLEANRRSVRLQELTRHLQGSICVIGPKHGRLPPALASLFANAGFCRVEPNEMPFVRKLIDSISSVSLPENKAYKCLEFFKESFTNHGAHKTFIEGILKSNITRRPTDPEKQVLYGRHKLGVTPQLILDLILYFENKKVRCKRLEAIICLKNTIEKHLQIGCSIIEAFEVVVSQRKIAGMRARRRCVGTTLLLKGLEFDHAILLYNSNDLGWRNHKDLYVALTRGAKSVYMIS